MATDISVEIGVQLRWWVVPLFALACRFCYLWVPLFDSHEDACRALVALIADHGVIYTVEA
jgi:hypothetical protein